MKCIEIRWNNDHQTEVYRAIYNSIKGKWRTSCFRALEDFKKIREGLNG